MIVILEDLKISKFFKIIKYIFLRKKIYYLTKSSSKYEKFVEIIFLNKIESLSWKFRDLNDSSGINLYWYILHSQLEPFLNEIISNISVKNKFGNDDYYRLYISRVLSNIKLYPFNNKSILQLLFIIRSINTIFSSEKKPIILIINKVPLISYLDNFAKNYNIKLDYSNFYYLYRFLFLILLRYRTILGFIKRRLFHKELKLKNFKKKSNSIIIENSSVINKPNEFMINSYLNVKNCIIINRYANVPVYIKEVASKQGYEYLDLRNFNLKKYKFIKIKLLNFSFIENFFLNNISSKFFY